MRTQRERRDTADPIAYYTAQREAVAAVAQREGIDLVVLFGSAARRRLRPESDLDIAVRFVNGRPEFETEARVSAALHAALQPPRELDLVLLHHANPLLLIQVAEEGIPLYEASPDVWPLFWLYARRRFEDTEKFRGRRWEAHQERFLRCARRIRPLLQRKLTPLAAYLDELDAIFPATASAYTADSTLRRAVERLVQVVVEAATDAGDLLLAEEGQIVGDTTREIFEALHAGGIIDDPLRRRFALEYSALRNRIVHDYDELDNAIVWQAARQLVPDGRALVTALTVRLAAGPPAP